MRATDLLGALETPDLRNRLMPVRADQVAVRPTPAWLRRVWPRWAVAMALPWAIWVRPDALAGDPDALARVLVHELVHMRQWKVHGVVGFLRHYLGDYLRGRRRRLGHLGAYRATRFEAEAYATADRMCR